MTVKLAHNRDVLAGLLFLLLGAGGFWIALSYPYGSIAQMGPGFFPRIFSAMLIGFGLVLLLRGMRSPIRIASNWNLLPLLILSLAMFGFGWLIERVGLLISLCFLIAVSAYAGKEFKGKEVLLLTVFLCLLAVAIFIWGLGLSYALFAFTF